MTNRWPPGLKGMRWILPEGRGRPTAQQQAELGVLLGKVSTKRAVRAWMCRERVGEFLHRKQANRMLGLPLRRCTNVIR